MLLMLLQLFVRFELFVDDGFESRSIVVLDVDRLIKDLFILWVVDKGRAWMV